MAYSNQRKDKNGSQINGEESSCAHVCMHIHIKKNLVETSG